MAAIVAMKRIAQRILPEKAYRRLAATVRESVGMSAPDLATVRQAIENGVWPDASLIDIRKAIELKRRMDYEPHDIYLHVDSSFEAETRLHSCAKEPDTVAWIETFMQAGDTFFDIGANVGAYSLIAAKAFGGGVKVYAFEPAFLNFTQLCRNVFLNRCHGTVIPLSVALSDKTSLDSFNYHDLVPGGSQHTLGEAVDYKGDRFEPVLRQPVICFTMDDLIAQFHLPAPNHIKIDVDGVELLTLKGADRTLSTPTVRSIDIEVGAGEDERSITEFLSQRGFRVHERYERLTPGMFNCVFVRV